MFEIRCVARQNRLRLSDYRADPSDPYADAGFNAVLTADGLSAATGVHDVSCTRWSAFFGDLAASWRGWKGEKSVHSIERHLVLDATSDTTGHISLRVTLAADPLQDEWRSTCTLQLESGQLESLATRATRFFGAAP